MDFTEKMRLKGKAEEDLYFAHLDQKLIDAIHNDPNWQDTIANRDTQNRVELDDTPSK